LFDDEGETNTDSESNDEQKDDENVSDSLTLEKLNQLAGRKGEQAFKSVEDFEKHYGNLKSFVGKKETPKKETKDDRYEELRKEIEALKSEKTRDGFLSVNPEAKEYLDILEAYAEKKGITVSEAWEQKRSVFSQKEDVADVKSTNRIAPILPKDTQQLETLARQGNQEAQARLVRMRLHGE